jgi:hypothetical protein
MTVTAPASLVILAWIGEEVHDCLHVERPERRAIRVEEVPGPGGLRHRGSQDELPSGLHHDRTALKAVVLNEAGDVLAADERRSPGKAGPELGQTLALPERAVARSPSAV